jgi:pimeloyl-ACP methyl ester carboxylesterase
MRFTDRTGRNHPGADPARPGTDADIRAGTVRDLPLAERRLEPAGIPTVVLEGGEGPTAILLHGPGEFAALWGRAVSRPAPSFAGPLAGFLVHPTERSRDRFLGRCMYDFDGMRRELGPRWDPFAAYALDRARQPGARSAVVSLVTAFGLLPIRRRDLGRIPVPVSMIWGRHDLQNRLHLAEAAAARFGWPLEVVEGARDDPCWERPEAAVAALRAALARPLRRHVAA